MPGPCAPFFGGTNPLRRAMESLTGAAFLERKSVFWFVITVTIVLLAITNLPWQLDDRDQAAPRWLVFRRALRRDTILGIGVAATVHFCGPRTSHPHHASCGYCLRQ